MWQFYLNVSARMANVNAQTANVSAQMTITVCEQFSQKYQLAQPDTRKGCHSDKWPAKIGVCKFWPYCARTGTNNVRNNNTNNARTASNNVRKVIYC